ncbi:MAG: hypothetical protein KKC84_05375, partial [Candidatus Omnitrophica bacterium]|nr:hypothetical protein [Candidatus Omnitrophota bacterium]
SSDTTLTGDLAVNGGDVTSTSALTVTPSAGTNLNVALSTTGDLAVNTNQLYVDTSATNVGIGTVAPLSKFSVAGGAAIGATYAAGSTAPTSGLIIEGALGIGTSDPGAYKLYVDGDTYISGVTVSQGNLSFSGDLDMNTKLITNIGNAGTDFVDGGGLTLAADLAVNGGDILSSGALAITPGTTLTLNPPAGNNLNINLGTTGDLAVNTNQLYVDTSEARVGINNNAPGYDLEVTGTAYVSGATGIGGDTTLTGDLAVNGGDVTSTSALTVTPSAGTNLNVALSTTGDFAVNTNDLYVDTSAGRVGINNVAPGYDLDVTGTAHVSSDTTLTGDLAVNGGDVTSTSALTVTPGAGTNLNVALSTTGDLAVNTNQLYVDTSEARVGINNNAPGYDLEVTGTAYVSGAAGIGGDTTLTGDLAVNGGDVTSSGALTVTPSAGTNLNVALSTTGDFAVNTNQLYVDTSAGNVGIGTVTPLGLLQAGTSPTPGLLVTASGNVGIGTTNPGNYKLYVDGDTYIGGVTVTNSTLTFGGALDMDSSLITNIGDTGTDFVAGGGLTLAGTLTGNGAVTLGDNGDAVAINSNVWDITGPGVASGLTGITSSGTINFGGLTASSLVATDASKNLASTITLANLVSSVSDVSSSTGSTNLVLSASPTLTGTVTAAAATLSGTLTANGALNANAAVTLGDNGDAVAINSNVWDITGPGVASGLTGLSSSGTITFTGLGTGTDNSVVILNGSNALTTDEVDSRVWGTSLVDYSGTNTGYVGKFSDADTITKSVIYDTGTNVGIGTTNPSSAKLQVLGTVYGSAFSDDGSAVSADTAQGYLSTGLSTGLVKVTTGTGALSVVTDSTSNWDTAYTHSQATTNVHGLTFTSEGSGGGLDADTVDTYTTATAATANTLALRDANGDLTTRYFMGSYMNSADDVSAGTLTYLMGKFGDNYYRSATAAKVATFLSGQTMNIVGSATTATTATTANSGDSATAFFSSGTIEDARLSFTLQDAVDDGGCTDCITDAMVSNTLTASSATTATSATTAGTVTTAAQPSITSLGTLTSLTTSGPLYRSAAGAGYLNGQYSSVETTTTSGAIYSIGGSYVPGTTTLGNMYGVGYGYSGGGGITFTGLTNNLWGLYVASNGTPSVFLDSDNGRIFTVGDIHVGSITPGHGAGTADLFVAGNLEIDATAYFDNAAVFSASGLSTSGPVTQTGSNQVVFAGNVGAGHTNPGAPLHVSSADNTDAVKIQIRAAQASITAADVFMKFDSTSGTEGSIAGTASAGVIAYNTFTGSHWTKIDDKTGLKPNMLLEATGEKFMSKEQLVKSRICATKKSQAVYGVFGGTNDEGNDLVLALGTGFIWVTNTNGDIAVGDYLQASGVPGIAEKQDDDILHNYSVAKALEPVVWQEGETEKLIACTYHSG